MYTQYGNLRFNLLQIIETDCERARKKAHIFCIFHTTDSKHLLDDYLLAKYWGHRIEYHSVCPLRNSQADGGEGWKHRFIGQCNVCMTRSRLGWVRWCLAQASRSQNVFQSFSDTNSPQYSNQTMQHLCPLPLSPTKSSFSSAF